jgi:hypothetical protein
MLFRTALAALAAATIIIPATVSSGDAGDYVGLETCAACHTDVAASFAKTAHANALEVLKEAGSDGDPECLKCHATGVSDSKYVDGAVTCESCHGPGSEHVATGDKAAIHAAVGEADCLKCHTPDWSPDFDFETYKAKGVHATG